MQNPIYAPRIQLLSESTTIAISSLARDLKAQGKDILSFSAGEPDFDTPKPIRDEAIRALNSGFTHYTAVGGIPELRKAICEKLERENGLHYDPSEVIVSNGAKHSLFNVLQALVCDGDEVIIPTPYWVSYPEIVTYCGGTNVFIPTDEKQNFKITPKQLKEAITPKTKILVLNSPSNPTGIVYSKEELEELAQILAGSNIWVLSDEIYEKLVYDITFCSSAAISQDMLERTILINGLSKAVAMTGWRVGYVACKDKQLIKYMDNLQSQCTSNVNSIAQKASVVALGKECVADIEEMRLAFKERMEVAYKLFNTLPGISLQKPQGAFYLFPNIQEIAKFKGDSMRFCQELLQSQGVALVPGSAFGKDGYVRFSFACNTEQIQLGIERIARFIKDSQ
ncbi:MAG: pyridoxal phosphate-dependent aminotransferase [Helicobacter sp.]|uniref:Aminotransferase n=1 Tax=Helicobacter equorum TaxID=361872 RepID=A0A3D8IQ56_9HELI|nr:pyridoxal phosphate-dependent aminotransferase [Helicobacter equorum]MCI6313024.1 pyridoxal phosphate-dependent aminotransferase [Helicobacter sp.]MDY2824002.1 pyridoxal phosphate-dependent aminotransferase [Helicobacter sp.]RDU67399.1 pyridoxal phosphate-dependent aminotransferase [Helicobacter equorum]